MRILYLDCCAGIAGDMLLGALIDAGANFEEIKKQLLALGLPGLKISIAKGKSKGISACQVHIQADEDQAHRHLQDIIEIIEKSDLPDLVKTSVLEVFGRIAQAEARVHGTTTQDVHFHEVGAVDSICDIVGCLLAVHDLKVDKIICSFLPMGHGFVQCEHGSIPVPAPATLELLKGIPVCQRDIEGELVTPTGAALAVTLAETFSSFPSMIVEKIGYGMGTRDFPFPNIVRAVLGEQHGKEQDQSYKHQHSQINEHMHSHGHEHNHNHRHDHEHKHEHNHEHENEHKHEHKQVTRHEPKRRDQAIA